MASGHANRANRPNTWLHRPATQREDSSCQPGAVHTWHSTGIEVARFNVQFRALFGHQRVARVRHGLTRSGPWHSIETRSHASPSPLVSTTVTAASLLAARASVNGAW